jgi:hypothetical protein
LREEKDKFMRNWEAKKTTANQVEDIGMNTVMHQSPA